MIKYLLVNPLLYIIVFALMTLGYQLFNWANLAYFVAEVYDSGLTDACQWGCSGEEIDTYPKDCYYYWWCLNMVNEVSAGIIEFVGVIILFIFSILIGSLQWKYFWFSLWGWIISYMLIISMKSSDWFGSCSDFCGFQYFSILPLIFLLTFVISRRKNSPERISWSTK